MEQLREVFESLGWVDVTALVIIAAFAVLGLVRGMVWQVSRVLAIVAAYTVSVWFGGSVAIWARGWLPGQASVEVAQYVSWSVIFLAVLVVSSIAAAIVQRLIQNSPLSPLNRLGGAMFGVATGGLIVLTLLTGVQLTHGVVGVGASVAQAASDSRSQMIGDRVLAATGSALPDEWRGLTREWRSILAGDDSIEERLRESDEDRRENPGRGPIARPESRY